MSTPKYYKGTRSRNPDLTLDEEIELDIMDGVVLKAGALVTTDDDGSRWVECHVRVSSGKSVPLEDIRLELITEPLMPIKFLE